MKNKTIEELQESALFLQDGINHLYRKKIKLEEELKCVTEQYNALKIADEYIKMVYEEQMKDKECNHNDYKGNSLYEWTGNGHNKDFYKCTKCDNKIIN